MATLFQDSLLRNSKAELIDASLALKDKVIGLYFSAHWCPHCPPFTANLKDFYSTVNEKSSVLEIVFISSDNNAQDMNNYLTECHGPWLSVPFDDPLRNELKKKYGVCAAKEQNDVDVLDRKAGIPSLVIVHSNGDLLDLNGYEAIENEGLKAFNKWKLQQRG